MKEQELYWGMHFCNSKMFKTIAQIEMYTRSKKKEGEKLLQHKEQHVHYYMTEYGQIFKFDKENFDSYELDLQNMLWFRNRDFVAMYLGNYMKYTEINEFVDCYEDRSEKYS